MPGHVPNCKGRLSELREAAVKVARFGEQNIGMFQRRPVTRKISDMHQCSVALSRDLSLDQPPSDGINPESVQVVCLSQPNHFIVASLMACLILT